MPDVFRGAAPPDVSPVCGVITLWRMALIAHRRPYSPVLVSTSPLWGGMPEQPPILLLMKMVTHNFYCTSLHCFCISTVIVYVLCLLCNLAALLWPGLSGKREFESQWDFLVK